jgi:thiamine biosynthesis lipoprotein
MGTSVNITVAGASPAVAAPACAEVERLLQRLGHEWYPWPPEGKGELPELNAAIAHGATAEVSGELLALLKDSVRYSQLSGGRFDPGVGRLVQAWSFDHGERTGEANIPQEEIARWRAHPTSISELVFYDSASANVGNSSDRSVRRAGGSVSDHRVGAVDPQLLIDLGAIAKGRAVDLAVQMLRARGLDNFIVNAGGNLRAVGSAAGRPWKVAIQNPRGAGALAWLTAAGDESLSTSGDYQRFVTIDGRRYQHIMDPRSGWPVAGTEAITVIAKDATLADAASTALFVAGRDWPELARALGITQVLRIDDRGQIEVTRPLAARLQFAPQPNQDSPIRVVDL